MVLFVLLTSLSIHTPAGPASAQEKAGSPTFLPFIARGGADLADLTPVTLAKSSFLESAGLIEPAFLIDYDSFVWLGLDAANLTILRNSGVEFQRQPEAALLFLNRYRFDPLAGEPEIPPEQMTSYEPGEKGFHLVQFVGPTKDEWLDELQSSGASIIQFQPSHAYIVSATPEEAAAIDDLEFTRWVGVYHAAYRIGPSLVRPPVVLAAAQQVIDNVDLTIFDDGQVAETLAAIKELGGELIQHFPAAPDGTLLTAIVALPADSVPAVAQLNTILWLNYSSPEPGFDDEVAAQIVAGNQVLGAPFPGYNAWLTATGFNGAGVTAALVDTGMDTNNSTTAHQDIRGRIAAFVGYAGAPATDSNGHGTHVGGVIAGNGTLGTLDPNGFLFGLGVAPGAQLVVQNALSGTAWPPAGGWSQLSQDSVVNGAIASNNSWTTGGGAGVGYTAPAATHDRMVRDADFTTAAAAEPLIMVFSAGNSGPGASTMTEPKEAKNLISVGAAENFRNDPWVTAAQTALVGAGLSANACGNPININNMAGFSSRGPAMDGRILPTVTAPGTYIASLRSATGTFTGVPFVCDGIVDANYVWMSGTSQAVPQVTGGVALITQWWRGFNSGANPSPAMAKALLVNGAVDMGVANIPNGNEGWGRMDLNNVLNPTAPVIYSDQATTFGATGQSWSLSVGPADATLPLKVSLVWSDAPGAGSGGTTGGWVNDLDLSAVQGATTFRGNVFVGGQSAAGGLADRINNVENIFIQNPSGVYDITVSAFNVAGDGVPLDADLTDQDFAFVCFNCVEAADLSVAKSDAPDPAVAGDEIEYTITVSNGGPGQATGALLTDTLPAGVSFVSSNPGSPDCNAAGSIVTCSLGDMVDGATRNAIITVLVDADLVFNNGGPISLSNGVTVVSPTPDADPANNSATEDTLVVAQADLEIVTFAAVDPPVEILIGEDVDITLRKEITNHGPSAPMDVELTATAAAAPGASVAPPNVLLEEAALALNEIRPVLEVFTVSCQEPGSHTFTFTNEIRPLDPADSDPNLANNQAEYVLELACVLPVTINIKPGSDPNSINPLGSGEVPLAILTTSAGEYGLPHPFDATTVDPLSVRFGPSDLVWTGSGGAFEAHDRGHIEDSRELDEITRDGDADMVLHFNVQETGISAGTTEACVKGEWLDPAGDVYLFFGCDAVRIPPGGAR
jgi:uncharacterized repeat protein (TIGR01451 family)